MVFSFFPRTIYQAKSKISGEIVIKEQFGKNKLYVQGVLQSGGIVGKIWKRPLKRISFYVSHVTKVLVLGLGGGTVVGLVKQHWPKAKIIGVEIDPEIIKAGKKYFGLGQIKNLQIIQADAFKTISNQQSAISNFDLIIVDLYLGKEFPKKGESKEFFENVKKGLRKNGVVVFNRLRTKEANLGEFENRLKKHFPSIKRVKTASNFFFIARS